MDFASLIESVGQLGIMAGLVVYFVYQTNRNASEREDRMASRITHLEDQTTQQIMGLMTTAAARMAESTEAIKQNTAMMDELGHVLKEIRKE